MEGFQMTATSRVEMSSIEEGGVGNRKKFRPSYMVPHNRGEGRSASPCISWPTHPSSGRILPVLWGASSYSLCFSLREDSGEISLCSLCSSSQTISSLCTSPCWSQLRFHGCLVGASFSCLFGSVSYLHCHML